MILTIAHIENWYNIFNAKYFNNSLPTIGKHYGESVYIELSKRKKVWGDFWYRAVQSQKMYRIRLSNYYERAEKAYQETLLHEMIHLYVRRQYNEGGHGYYFKRECNRINKDGWNLSRTTARTEDDKPNFKSNTTKTILLFKRNEDDKIWAASISPIKKYYYINWLNRSTALELLDIIEVPNNAILDNWSVCRTRLYSYPFTKEVAHKMFPTAILSGNPHFNQKNVWSIPK